MLSRSLLNCIIHFHCRPYNCFWFFVCWNYIHDCSFKPAKTHLSACENSVQSKALCFVLLLFILFHRNTVLEMGRVCVINFKDNFFVNNWKVSSNLKGKFCTLNVSLDFWQVHVNCKRESGFYHQTAMNRKIQPRITPSNQTHSALWISFQFLSIIVFCFVSVVSFIVRFVENICLQRIMVSL